MLVNFKTGLFSPLVSFTLFWGRTYLKDEPFLSELRVRGKKRVKKFSYRNKHLWTLKSRLIQVVRNI